MSDLSEQLALDLERIEVDTWSSITEAAPPETARSLGVSWCRIGPALAAAASRLDVLMYNLVVGLGVGAPARESDVDQAIQFFRAAGSPRFMVTLPPHSRPSTIGSWLPARGFRPHNHWIKLWRTVSDPASGVLDPRVREMGPAHAEAFARCGVEAFDLPEAGVPWLAATVGRPGFRHYAAFDGDDAVGFGALYVDGGVGWLGMASTRPSHRRQGIQSALIATRLREAARLGCEIVAVETADDTPEKPNPSTHNLIRMGFQVAYRRANWVRQTTA